MLRPDTQALWDRLKTCPAMRGFVLVGGTALTMHLGHRISEDLDFMWSDVRLPKGRIAGLHRWCDEKSITLAANDSAAAIKEFEDSGSSLRDYQQDYVATGTVKLTLVAPLREVRVFLPHDPGAALRVATVEEIFRLKCLACADRSKSRDWLDLYLMLSQRLFEPIEVLRTFQTAGVPAKFDIAMLRLCQAMEQPDDEGYKTLMPQPPTLQQMKDYFVVLRDQIEVEAASERLRQ